jgi:pyruvate/2-oxoacid:ferredoxin oxidoreductase beta subunit
MTKEALKLALEALEYAGPSWIESRQPAITAIKDALANEALDKMAENARELGLDYEPAQRTWVGLTDEEMQSIAFESADALSAVFVAEAKLKEKNT